MTKYGVSFMLPFTICATLFLQGPCLNSRFCFKFSVNARSKWCATRQYKISKTDNGYIPISCLLHLGYRYLIIGPLTCCTCLISKVGVYLKTPRYPIWLVCSESHFSVLFGLQRELLTSQDTGLEFDLYYYDGLANQQEEIRLTVCM